MQAQDYPVAEELFLQQSPKGGGKMVILRVAAVSGFTPEQVAGNIQSLLRTLPPSVGGMQLKLSPDAKKALGGKRKAHTFLDEVTALLH